MKTKFFSLIIAAAATSMLASCGSMSMPTGAGGLADMTGGLDGEGMDPGSQVSDPGTDGADPNALAAAMGQMGGDGAQGAPFDPALISAAAAAYRGYVAGRPAGIVAPRGYGRPAYAKAARQVRATPSRVVRRPSPTHARTYAAAPVRRVQRSTAHAPSLPSRKLYKKH
jgi:hypothetical protein